ncbi:hypothetical protein [Caulobacter radicis]|uniref:hypothetical protein n=1 Tax=Caulobacter radicis TaxID=2172650 RepID=UPI001057A03A|nr:hypothetical protein [Caulobacter radicis]
MADGAMGKVPTEEQLAAAALDVAGLLGFADLLPAYAAAQGGEKLDVLGAIVRVIAADVLGVEPGGDRIAPESVLLLGQD